MVMSRVGHTATGVELLLSRPTHEVVLQSDMKGASAGVVALPCTGAGAAVHSLIQDLDKKKVQQQRYGIEAVLGLQASNDVMRQELYHEKGGRARDKTALSLALAEATARAVLADTVAADCR